MTDKELAVQHENGYADWRSGGMGKKPTLMQRWKAHIRKWWWLHLVVFIACTLLIVLLLVYVGFPRISQSGVDASTIEITNLTALTPAPTSVHLIQDSLTHSNNTYHPYLDPFNASLSLAGSAPYGMVQLPGMQSGTSVPAHIDQVLQITNLEAFTEYNTALFNSESIRVRVNGSTWLHEMALPASDVSYDHTTTVTGFNSLKGFNITDFNVMLSPDKNGNNINGTAFVPNPTVISFELGNVTYNTYVNDTLIGNTTIMNFMLDRGNHTYPFVGYSNQSLILSLLESTYKDGKLPVKIIGESAVYNGNHLTYYEAALKKNVQMVTLNVGAALASIGINITSGGL